jgi:hypothetical protein
LDQEDVTATFDYECALMGLGGGGVDPASQVNVLRSSDDLHQWFPFQKTPAQAEKPTPTTASFTPSFHFRQRERSCAGFWDVTTQRIEAVIQILDLLDGLLQLGVGLNHIRSLNMPVRRPGIGMDGDRAAGHVFDVNPCKQEQAGVEW